MKGFKKSNVDQPVNLNLIVQSGPLKKKGSRERSKLIRNLK